MTIRMLLAGIAMNAVLKLQYATRGKCGGFGLHSKLWQIYTNDYQTPRTGYIREDWKRANA